MCREAVASGLVEAGFRGGAVVDGEGRVVGVVRSVRNSEALIRMVGHEYIRSILGPGIGDVNATRRRTYSSGAVERSYLIEANVHDPGSRILLTEARIIFVDSRTSLAPSENGVWPRYEPAVAAKPMSVSNSRIHRGRHVYAYVSATWSLAPTEIALAQVMFSTSNGEVHYSRPLRLP